MEQSQDLPKVTENNYGRTENQTRELLNRRLEW
jgi:hypothetical protein